MMSKNYQNIFAQIIGICERYKNIDEITGENFNVFRILKLESAEVRMHSAFIGELLSPKGSHGQKNTFLQLFIDKFCFKEYRLDSLSCTVEVEKHTGFVTNDKLFGGRLDIFIKDKFGQHLIIENKIYASDQNNQLVRYSNHSRNANLLYLTLNGSLPSKKSCGNLEFDKDYRCISYETDIVNWLESCRKEASVIPILRESITQYINLIKYLTNQTINHAMQEDISEIIKANLQASILIADNLKNTQSRMIVEFGKLLRQELKKRGLELNYDLNLMRKYNGFYVSKSTWQELQIVFQFQVTDKELVYGIASINDPLKIPISSELRAQVELIPNNSEKGNKWWPWIQKMEIPYDNWHNYDVWQAIKNGEMILNVLSKVDLLLVGIGDTEL